MNADEMAREWLACWSAQPVGSPLGKEITKKLATLLRAYAASRLRAATGELDDMAAGWTGDGRTHEVVRLCTRMVAERAAQEEQR